MQPLRSVRSLIQRLLPGLVALATALVVACHPYPETRPTHRGPKPVQTKPAVEKSEADKLKEKEKLAKEKEKKAADELKKTEAEKTGKVEKPEKTPEITEKPEIKEPGKTPPPPKPVEYEVAKRAPGREGFVLSPYNQKLIDVRGFKSGDVVGDPTYDKSEKKFFRVP